MEWVDLNTIDLPLFCQMTAWSYKTLNNLHYEYMIHAFSVIYVYKYVCLCVSKIIKTEALIFKNSNGNLSKVG